MTYAPLTDDQSVALFAYTLEHGEDWKQDLLDDWRTGADVNALADDMGCYLRQLRNSHGPSWLNTKEA